MVFGATENFASTIAGRPAGPSAGPFSGMPKSCECGGGSTCGFLAGPWSVWRKTSRQPSRLHLRVLSAKVAGTTAGGLQVVIYFCRFKLIFTDLTCFLFVSAYC